jgi:hypothetical protein
MTEEPASTKARLLADIDRYWTALNAMLERLTEAQMTTLTDAQGWTVKDHLIHLAAWERSVVFFLQGQPRYAGLGVEETLYRQGTGDEINAVIYHQHRHLSLDEALTQFRSTHQQLLTLLQPLMDADLHKPYRHYLPDEPDEGDSRLALQVVFSNTANHFVEHLHWIEALVNQKSEGL